MKKVSRKIISAMSSSKKPIDSPDPIDLPQVEHDPIDAFYQRMFDRDIYLHVSEVSVAMVGVCLTGVSILNVDQDVNSLDTYVDDLLAIDSVVFLIAYLLSYWVVRVMTRGNRNVRRVGNIANAIFLIGMVFMAIICICVVYQGDFTPKLDGGDL
jgi:magnesium-transporting ATPase (P-type)